MPAPSRLALWLLPLCFLIAGCATTSSKSDVSLGSLVVERLSWMDDVARYKQARGLPVTDPAREAALLEAMTTLGAENGLPSTAVRGFFAGQMAAARQYQKEWLASPESSASTSAPMPDLQGSIRPALDKLGRQMISALAQARSSSDPKAVADSTRRSLTEAGYSKAVIALAMDGVELGLSR